MSIDEANTTYDTSKEPSTVRNFSRSNDNSIEYAQGNESPEIQSVYGDNMNMSDDESEGSVDFNNVSNAVNPDQEDRHIYIPQKIDNPDKFDQESEESTQESLRKIQTELDAAKSDVMLASHYFLVIEGFPTGVTSADITDQIEEVLDNLYQPLKNPYFSIVRGATGTVLMGISHPKTLYQRLADTFVTGTEYGTLYFYSVPMAKMPRMLRRTKDREKRKEK